MGKALNQIANHIAKCAAQGDVQFELPGIRRYR